MHQQTVGAVWARAAAATFLSLIKHLFYPSNCNSPFKSTRRASRKCVTRCQRGPTWACQVTWRLPDDSVILQMADVPPSARKHLPGGDMCVLRMTLTRATERHLSDGALVFCKLHPPPKKKEKKKKPVTPLLLCHHSECHLDGEACDIVCYLRWMKMFSGWMATRHAAWRRKV